MTRKRKTTHHQGTAGLPTLESLAARQIQRNDKHHKRNTRNPEHFVHTLGVSFENRPRKKHKKTHQQSMGLGETRESDPNAKVGSGTLIAPVSKKDVPHNFSDKYTVKLSYADNYRHSMTYGTGANQIWRSNSIFDPDYTGGGHQPYARDLWASMYDYYCVISMEYEIHLYNGSHDPITWTAVGTAAQNVGSAQATVMHTTNLTDFITNGVIYPVAEMKNTQTIFIAPEETVVIRGTLDPSQFQLDAIDGDNDATWTAQAANPAVSRYFGYVLTPSQYASQVGQSEQPFVTIQAYAKLDYIVQFSQYNPSLRQTSS